MRQTNLLSRSVELPPDAARIPKERQYEWDAREETLPPCWIPRKDALTGPRSRTTETGRIYPTDATDRLRRRLISTIEDAQGTVCLASFLIADPEIVKELLRASRRGCRVYLLTASETQLLREPREDTEFDQQRREEHVQLLRELAGRVLVRSSDSFHSKFLLTDPVSTNPRGFLLTANLTTEALTRNPELAVELEKSEVHDLFREFLIGFWEESQNELLSPDRLGTVRPWEGNRQWSVPRVVLSTTKNIQTIRECMMNLIEQAESQVMLSTFGIDSKHPVTQRILKAAKDGKRIRILARPRPNKTTMNALVDLARAGAEVRGHPWLHAKSLIVDHDGSWNGMVMTSNVESRGLDEGFESGVHLVGKSAEDLRQVLEAWWREIPVELSVKARLGDVEGSLQVWQGDRLFRVLVESRGQINLGEIQAKSSEEMESNAPPSLRKPMISRDSILYKRILYTWRLLPPKP